MATALTLAAREPRRWMLAGRDKLGQSLASIAAILVLLAAWEGMAQSGAVSSFVLPPFSVVVARIYEDLLDTDLAVVVGHTLYRSIGGFVIASVLGVVLGLLIATVRPVRWFFDPLISIAFPMPKIVFLPIVILWLGVHDVSKLTMVVIDSILPVVTATVVGITATDRLLLWSARSMGTSDARLLTNVYLPAALPTILTGMQVALPIALIVTIVCEMLMGGYGLGGLMIEASRFSDATGVFAGIVEAATVGFILIRGMALLRRRLLRWHAETLSTATF